MEHVIIDREDITVSNYFDLRVSARPKKLSISASKARAGGLEVLPTLNASTYYRARNVTLQYRGIERGLNNPQSLRIGNSEIGRGRRVIAWMR